MTQTTLTLPRPDDWHLHLRNGELLQRVLAATARHFARAIVMPNLSPPVTSHRLAAHYRDEIIAAMPAGQHFDPLMTCYLTDRTDADDLLAGARDAVFSAAKLYPAGATTNSAAGVTRLEALDEVFKAMSDAGLPLLIHGEVVDSNIDIFDREAVFIDTVLMPLRQRFPALRIVLEHITTEQAVEYVQSAPAELLAATITPHHLAINRNAMFVGGIRPHMYCLPVVKRERHRQALVTAATSGDAHFFLGTDSAPHLRAAKESACGCAGVYNAPSAMATYLEIFDRAGALDQFSAFASHNGARFYGLPVNTEQVSWRRGETPLSTVSTPASGDDLVAFEPPFALHWRQEADT